MSENSIKILHINCNYMGTKLHQTMIEHMNQYVSENKVFCPIYDRSDIVTIPNENVIVRNCFKPVDRLFFYRKQRKIIDCLIKNINVKTFDCIHAYTLFTDGNCAYELSKKFDIPFVVAIRATDLFFFRYRLHLRKRGLHILKNAAQIFFLSEKTKELFIKKYIPQKEQTKIAKKIKVIPNGIDDFWLKNCFWERNVNVTKEKIMRKELRIICVSQIIKRKNIPTLQKAIKQLCKEGWTIRLDIIGKGVDQYLLKRIKKDKHTKYYEPIEKEDLIKFYRNADIFVLPSKRETFGLVYAEAMTQGLPVIYTSGQGFDGQFDDGVIGMAVQSNKVSDIVQAIKLVVKKYTEMEKNTIELAGIYNWHLITRIYFDIYKQLLK